MLLKRGYRLISDSIKIISHGLLVTTFISACNNGTSTSHQVPLVNTTVISPGTTTQLTLTNTTLSPIVNPSVTLASWLDTLSINKNLTYA